MTVLPSQVHPSYPYGNPTNIKHPAARPRPPHASTSRALFEDMGYAGGGVNGTLRWKDLAMDILLPVNHEKEEAERAAQARKMASGASSSNNPPAQTNIQGDQGADITDEEEGEEDEDQEEDEEEEEEQDENEDGVDVDVEAEVEVEDEEDEEDNIDENLNSFDASFEEAI